VKYSFLYKKIPLDFMRKGSIAVRNNRRIFMQLHHYEVSNAQVAYQTSMARIHELLARLQMGVDVELTPGAGTLH
jgi:hypothetical protein